MIHFRVFVLAKCFLLGKLTDIALQRFELKLRRTWGSKSAMRCIKETYELTTEDDINMRDVIFA